MRLPQTILATSAIAITAIAIVEAGRLHPTAEAGTASMGIGGYTAITASVGQGSDVSPVEILYVLDNRSETMLVYSVEVQVDRRMVLLGGASLPALFRAGRG
ncbi:MAG: hypothetical protein DWI09_00355 [Planctomycetota bacterium]|nr:MAG: hypothetical protein DWI09_00355 [Planctomycetota bacterium]